MKCTYHLFCYCFKYIFRLLFLRHMVAFPNKTPEGYNVLLYRLADYDYSKLNFADAVRVFCMFNDVKLSEDQGQAEGYIVIFDMKGCSLGHLTRVTLPALRAFMHYIQVSWDKGYADRWLFVLDSIRTTGGAYFQELTATG